MPHTEQPPRHGKVNFTESSTMTPEDPFVEVVEHDPHTVSDDIADGVSLGLWKKVQGRLKEATR